MTHEKISVWTPELDLVRPIDSLEIPNFLRWVNYKGFRNPVSDHYAFDFSAYLNHDGKCVIGLPDKTIVRAVKDGVVAQILDYKNFRYATNILLSHGEDNDGVYSDYHHIIPWVEQGDIVRKGQAIGALYHQKAEMNRPEQKIHLHFELTNGFSTLSSRDRYNPDKVKERYVDPALILFSGNDLAKWKDYKDCAIKSRQSLDDVVFHPEMN
jgi:hypothetical protein